MGKKKIDINAEIKKLSGMAETKKIDPELYTKYNVKRGLRDISGKGVMAGLTDIAEVRAYIVVDDEMVPCLGQLFYRGIDVKEIVKGFEKDNRFGFEEVCYLLLFGRMPSTEELIDFNLLIDSYRKLPESFTSDVIMKLPSHDVMNALSRTVLTLYALDENADDTSIENVVRQSVQLIAQFPTLAVHAYQAFEHYYKNGSLHIHMPKEGLSTAENILYMLRPDSNYTEKEAKMLDVALVLHAEHGGGNNSSFTTHVVTSSGTDTYSSIAASLVSLKGPKHGGANIKVSAMMDNIKENVKDIKNEEEIKAYLLQLLRKEAFDKSGLIYGMGHAVYSLSDPRAEIFKSYIKDFAEDKGMMEEYEFYSMIERLAPEVISEERKIYKGVSANIDFYSGFVYKMLGLPPELYTPIFAIARVSGWCAHRIEELVNAGKIIRPAYKSVAKNKEYIPLDKR